MTRQTGWMTSNKPSEDVPERDALFSLPLDRFTDTRDALAARLRTEGRNDEADEVGRLRKPSVAAWALNRVARNSPGLVGQLLDAHRQLRHSDSVESLGSASESRRVAMAALVEAAVEELTGDGRRVSAQIRDRIASTLLAVATDPQGEADFEAGRLVRELEPSGDGWGDIGLTVKASVPTHDREAAAAEKARQRAERLEREAAEAERRLEQAQKTVGEAKRRAKRARAEADQAAQDAQRAEEIAKGLGC